MAEKSKQLPAPKTTAVEKVKPPQLAIVEEIAQELQTIGEHNFYVIPGGRGRPDRKEPDARALQFYANKVGIATQILDSGMNHEQAWATIRAWRKDKPDEPQEDKVTLDWQIELESLIWDRVDKGCERHKSGCPVENKDGKVVIDQVMGTPILTDSYDMMAARRQINRKRRFGEREAITKAKSRLYKLLLSFEWRDTEEIEGEESEVEAVKASKKGEAPIRTEQPAQATEKAKEEPKPQPAAPKPQPAKETPKPAEKAPAQAKEQAQEQPSLPMDEPTKETTKPPKAVIPPSPFAAPKKNSERIEEICGTCKVSSDNMLGFLFRILGVTNKEEMKTKPKELLVAAITAAEAMIKKFGPSKAADFIRFDRPEVDPEVQEYFYRSYDFEKKGSN